LTISTNSRIDVSGRGYLGARSGGNGGNVGRTLGNTTQGGSDRRNGGSYGGLGGLGSINAGMINATYGSFRNPDELGSGGGSDNGPAGNGGGLVRISAQQVSLDGQILANGGDGVTWGGGGSGGGIKITTSTLRGSGLIQANGGRGSGATGAGGGGGRIAVLYETATGFDFGAIQARGNTGASDSAAGTIYFR